jgi:DNA-binding CsgD family transcriptional regulator
MSEPIDFQSTFQDLLRERGAPAVYVVDEECRVVLSCDLPILLETPPDVRTELAVKAIERAVKELFAVHGKEARTFALPFRWLGGLFVARLVPLSGQLGRYTAVVVEPFKARDHLRAGSRRYSLTRRERDVVRLLIGGSRTAEIADLLGVAPSTVILHVKGVMSKTGSRTRAEMLARIMTHDADTAQNGPT